MASKGTVSPQKYETQRDAYLNSEESRNEAKRWVMNGLHMLCAPGNPNEILSFARGQGYVCETTVNITTACTELEKQGHVVSTNEVWEGHGRRNSVCVTLAAEHQKDSPPDPAIFLKTIKPTPFPAKAKWAVRKKGVDPEAFTATERAHSELLKSRLAAALQAIEDRKAGRRDW